MKKLKRSDLTAAALAMHAGKNFDEALRVFTDEQAEILEYFEELAENEDAPGEQEQAFLLMLAVNVWHALRSNGMPPPSAGRKALLALEKGNSEKLRGLFSGDPKKVKTPEELFKSLDGHPQDELARAALLLALSTGDKKIGLDPVGVILPVMTVVDSLCGVGPRESLLAELEDLPPRRWWGIADFRVTEPGLDHTSRLMAGKKFSSAEEMNAFLRENCVGKHLTVPPAGPLQAAQDVIYQAMAAHSPRVRTRLARKALDIFPDCADAYNLLAEEEAKNDEEALEFYRKGIEAGARVLGAELEERRGELWGHFNARPYMRARAGEAHTLLDMGRREEAERTYYELLRLNKNDNQGIRYALLAFHAEKLEFGKMDALVNNGGYPNDCAAEWLYTNALATFALGKPDASFSLQAALAANKHIPDYLLGVKQQPAEYYPDSIRMGGEDEAYAYALGFKKAWTDTPGAMVWLRTGQKALAALRAGRNDPCPCGSGKKHKKCCGRLKP